MVRIQLQVDLLLGSVVIVVSFFSPFVAIVNDKRLVAK